MKILVADDEPAVLKVIVRLLGEKGLRHHLDLAANGRELVKFWKQGRHRVVISDVEMPEQDGIRACEEILAMDPTVQIIMTSGSLEAADRVEKAGLGPCLIKPFEINELLARISAPDKGDRQGL